MLIMFCYLQNLQTAQKKEAAKHCNCTIADVENALAKFTWAKEAQKKIAKLHEEGKPIPTSIDEVMLLPQYLNSLQPNWAPLTVLYYDVLV